MGNHIIWIVGLFTIQFSGILCRNNYYEYYYSRYHKGHSTTEVISSNTSGVTYEEASKSSVSDYKGTTGTSSTAGDTSSENLMHSSTVDHGTTEHSNMTVLQLGNSYMYQVQMTNPQSTGLIVGIVLICLFCTGIIICCCSCCLDWCCAKTCGKERKGYVVLSNSETTVTEAQPQQSQPLPSNYMPQPAQQIPTYYQSHPAHHQTPYYPEEQPQYQNIPTVAFQPHNFPEAPPPYEAPSYYKN